MCPGLTTWDWTKPLLKAATDEVKQPFEDRTAVFLSSGSMCEVGGD